jgi:hypothetical protein
LDFIHHPYVFCNHNVSRDGSSLVIRCTYSVGSRLLS